MIAVCLKPKQFKTKKKMAQLFEYAKNRFINPGKIIGTSIYHKQGQEPDEGGNYPIVYRVAIDLDVKDAPKATVYSDAYESEQGAKAFMLTIPIP